MNLGRSNLIFDHDPKLLTLVSFVPSLSALVSLAVTLDSKLFVLNKA